MEIWILFIGLVGSKASGITTQEFLGRQACEAAKPIVMQTMKDNGAPGWSGDGGVLVKAVCVKK